MVVTGGSLSLNRIVRDFAAAIVAVDSKRLRHKTYQPGIGPFPEKIAVAMVMNHMAKVAPTLYSCRAHEVRYLKGKGRCDLCLGTAPMWDWSVEIKLLRLKGDNGKPDDNRMTKILSPYPHHHSAVTDCQKILGSGFKGRLGIVIYGFDYPALDKAPATPMDPAIAAFELLAGRHVDLRNRTEATFSGLVHKVHRTGRVFGWEIQPPRCSGLEDLNATRTRSP